MTSQKFDIYFSSSPALLSSVDDFFVMKGISNLGVIETTNNLYNIKLLELVVPETVLSWTRAIVSHQTAKSGKNWAEIFSRYHSGTYTNQWMILDFNLFVSGEIPQDNFFTVIEEIPGLVHMADQTASLIEYGYWGSYNIPYYTDIADGSGYTKLCKIDVTRCHDTCPRANIFAQKQSSINDMSGIQSILQYNNWQTDPLSLNDSCNAIACRGDLEPKAASRGGFGALDAKSASVTTLQSTSFSFLAKLGPSSDQQKGNIYIFFHYYYLKY